MPQWMDKALREPQEKEIKALEGSRQDGAGSLELALTPRLAQPETGIKNLMSFQGQQMICCSCGLQLFICVESFFMSMIFALLNLLDQWIVQGATAHALQWDLSSIPSSTTTHLPYEQPWSTIGCVPKTRRNNLFFNFLQKILAKIKKMILRA